MRTLIPALMLCAVPLAAAGQDVCRRGDANGDRIIDVSDAIAIANHLFVTGGPLTCPNAADANDDGRTDISDVSYLLAALYEDGEPVPNHMIACQGAPFPQDESGPMVGPSGPGAVWSHFLLVTHASRNFDRRRHAKTAMDILRDRFAGSGLPVVYMLDYSPGSGDPATAAAPWFPKSRHPWWALSSGVGVFQPAEMRVNAGCVTAVGGYFLECYRRSVLSAVRSFFDGRTSGVMTVNIPMDGVFTTDFSDLAGGPLAAHNYRKAQAGAFASRGMTDGIDYLKYMFFQAQPNTVFGGLFTSPVGDFQLTQFRIYTQIDGAWIPRLFFGSGSRVVIFKFTTSTQ